MPQKKLKIRIEGDIDMVKAFALLISVMVEKSEVFKLESESKIYPNRPPNQDQGRVYQDFVWDPDKPKK